MFICGKKTLRYKQLLKNAFELPSHNTSSLIQFALSNPEAIPKLSKKLTKYNLQKMKLIRKKRKKRTSDPAVSAIVDSASIGISIFRELVEATHEEYLLHHSLHKMLDSVFNQYEQVTMEEHRLLIDILLLLETVPNCEMVAYQIRMKLRNLVVYTHEDESVQRKIRIGAMRVIARWSSEVRIEDLLMNVWSHRHEWNEAEILYQSVDNVSWNDHRVSLNEIQSRLKNIHVAKAALHCIGQIANGMRVSTIVKLIDPMLQFFDKHNVWTESSFAVTCLENILNYGWKENGFIILSLILPHISALEDSNSKSLAVHFVAELASKMTLEATQGSNSLVTTSVLLDQLVTSNLEEDTYRREIINALSSISDVRQRYCYNNFDITSAVFSAMDRVREPRGRLYVLDALVAVTTTPSYVLQGKNYPHAILRHLFKELNESTSDEGATVRCLRVAQNLAQLSSQDHDNSTFEHAETGSISAAISATSFSLKQEEELHFALVRLVEKLITHTPAIYSELTKMYAVLLRSYMHRELAFVFPSLFYLPDLLKENVVGVSMVNTLISIYMVLMALEFKDADLEDIVKNTIQSQVENKLVHGDFVSIVTSFYKQQKSSLLESLFEYAQTSKFLKNTFDRDNIARNISKIDRINQSGNLYESLMRSYTDFANSRQPKKLKKEFEWTMSFMQEDEPKSQNTIDLQEMLSVSSTKTTFSEKEVKSILGTLDSLKFYQHLPEVPQSLIPVTI